MSTKGDTVSTEQLEEMGPIDYVVLEWDGDQPVTGEVMPLLLDLVDRGVIRILDLAFMLKSADGTVSALDLSELAHDLSGAERVRGRRFPGLLGADDLEEAANALEPNTVAAVLVWENRWAAPVAMALRRSGGQLVANGRIPVQAILAALDASEAVQRLRMNIPQDCFAGVARTAAIAGTATAVSNHISAGRPTAGRRTRPRRNRSTRSRAAGGTAAGQRRPRPIRSNSSPSSRISRSAASSPTPSSPLRRRASSDA